MCVVAYAHAQQIGTADLLRGLADPSRWLIHSGDYTSKRHSPLTQLTPENVARLAPLWTFDTGLGFGRNAKFEATAIAIDGTLYVTGLLNHAWAIDGRTGLLIWHYQRKLPPDPTCCGLVNRGFAVLRRSSLHDDARCARGGDRSKDRYPDLGCADDLTISWATRRPLRRSSSRTS